MENLIPSNPKIVTYAEVPTRLIFMTVKQSDSNESLCILGHSAQVFLLGFIVGWIIVKLLGIR